MITMTWCPPCDRYVQGNLDAHQPLHDRPDPAVLVELHDAGYSYSAIADRFGWSRAWVAEQVASARRMAQVA